MEFDEDSQNEDNGNVDMDADDQGDKKYVQTPPKKNWTINKKTDLTNVSPDEYKDQVTSMKSPAWNNDLQAINSDNPSSQVVEGASASQIVAGKKGNRTKRQLLKVRSNSSNMSMRNLTHVDSRALDNP